MQDACGKSSTQRIILVVGPTASGKSELAVRLAEEVGGEIVNADSMQFYVGMEIGTARPPVEMMHRVPHHLFGILQPNVNFTVADFVTIARETISEIVSRRKVPLVVGGTGLYLRVLLGGLAESPSGDEEYRKELIRLADEHGSHALHDLLSEVDRITASRLHVNDRLRIIRALEVHHQTGRPISELHDAHGFSREYYDSLKIGLSVERGLLYERIDKRVDTMIEEGLVSEVQSLISRGYSPELKSMGAIGYKEICGHLAGRLTLPEAVGLMKQNTRRYAKRQLTWFRKDAGIKWLEYPESFDNIKRIVCDFINRRSV